MWVSGSLGSLEKTELLPGPRLRLYNSHGSSIFFAQEWFRNSSKDGDNDEDEDEDDGKILVNVSSVLIICLAPI